MNSSWLNFNLSYSNVLVFLFGTFEKNGAQWEIVVSDPTWFRNSRLGVFSKKGVLKNSTKFTGKHLWQSLFFNKVAGLRPATLLKKILWHWCFPVDFTKFLRTPFYIEHLWSLLLMVAVKLPDTVSWEI